MKYTPSLTMELTLDTVDIINDLMGKCECSTVRGMCGFHANCRVVVRI